MELNGLINEVKKELDIKDRRREEVFALAREVRRVSTKAIREIHKGNFEMARELIDDAGQKLKGLSTEDTNFSFLQEAIQEYCEAAMVYAFLKGEEVPSYKDLRVPIEGYVLGLADTIGELRRHILDIIRRDRADDVEYYLDLMDEIAHGIMTLDYPAAILPIRRKQDIARILLEKTRGDVTLALKLSQCRPE
jgi:translin